LLGIEINQPIVAKILDDFQSLLVERHRNQIDQACKDDMSGVGTTDASPVKPLVDKNVSPEDARKQFWGGNIVPSPEKRNQIFFKGGYPAGKFPVQTNFVLSRGLRREIRLLLRTARGGHEKPFAYGVAGLYLGNQRKFSTNNA
jgi:hypothetical protein